ncbi:ActS/PrrB/RegB family redox-sensitive histidine kinase [Albimonas sp. CAU 1670]|uniref:ActS/PrrB/RegB family redox-sensitive histidine kinase n=1 Tax=Albimonas sp. CAU 1670 TaxID=3032599 RepID=UPI0023DB28D7|nr:ActS/PrrB/RegB family redox-sensitive histidine kinase [Albimonas sp. CAU 1670]MDF2232492.1 ActS/PrrB/RegB family redox-sensitive histidine kinase [Albimonas sp. CAU 1670]
MADGLPFGIPARGRVDWVRLRTLTSLRWLAALGQGAAVLVAHLALDIELPIGACFGAIAASVSLNIVAEAVHAPNKRLSERGVALTLLFDLAQLGALLFLTGGLTNPFALLVLAPVIVSATALSLRSTLILGVFAAAEISLLALVYIPLVLADGTRIEPQPLILVGTWAALMTGLAFVAGYARRVTAEMWTMTKALGAAQEALGREQRLTAIGGLAAAAAHELGTPLATIKLVAGELARELRTQPDLYEDVDLIRQQAERCREILRELSATGKDDRQVRTAPIYRLVEEAAGPHSDRGKRVILRLQGRPLSDPPPPQPEAMRRPEVIHGLRNLVQNAVDFAEACVWIDVDWNERTLRIAVGDDGPGFGADMLGRLGDPFVRARMRPAAGVEPPAEPAAAAAEAEAPAAERREAGADGRAGYEGMGLGLFIAKTLLERTGARVSFANGGDEEARAPDARSPEARLFPETARAPGAVVEAVWPRGALDLPEGRPKGALGENETFTLRNV